MGEDAKPDAESPEPAQAPATKQDDAMSLKDWTLEPMTLSPAGSGTAIVNAKTGKRYEYTFPSSLVRGVHHPPFITEDVWEAQRSALKFGEGDVFVCTFSKCGTTLAEQIVLLILNGGKADELNPLHKNTLDRNSGKIGKVWTEMAVVDGLPGMDDVGSSDPGKACMGEGKARMTAADFDALPRPRILKTHEPTNLFLALADADAPPSLAPGVKVIYVTRNPFDACVSCYYHPKPGVSPSSTGCPFEAFARLWLSDRVEFGGWADHTGGWRRVYDGTAAENMLWMSYEDLVARPRESIKKMADFLGVESDETLVDRVADGCSFKNVKKAAEEALASGSQGDIGHLRKGGAGDWRNHFSDSLRTEFESELSKLIGGKLDVEYDIGGSETWKLGGGTASETDGSSESDAFELESNTCSSSNDKKCWEGGSDTIPVDTTRMADIKVIGIMMVFYCFLQTCLSYLNEFYADDIRDKRGLPQPHNFPMVSIVLANIFNGVSAGLAIGTAVVSGRLVRHVWANRRETDAGRRRRGRFVMAFFVSIVVESVVTSGVIHSVAHRLFGSTLEGNAWVEFWSHLGFGINVIATALFMILWLGPQYLAGDGSTRPGYLPRIWEVLLAATLAVLAALFTEVWVPYTPIAKDFDFPEDTVFDEEKVVMIQGHVQALTEAVLLIPTVLFLFILFRLWRAVSTLPTVPALSRTTYRVSILAVAVPLCLNWIHFRAHDNLAHWIQGSTGWVHYELIAAIRLTFHIPNWIFAIGRLHYFRRMTERAAGWPSLDIIETLCPGREVWPFLLCFLYRASEGMTLALLPSFFQGATETENFHLDITANTWLAVTVLGMFLGNAVGAVMLGWLMQRKGYQFAYTFVVSSFTMLLPLYMIPHTNVSFLILRCVSALIFPGPVVLSRVTQSTRRTFTNAFTHVPMVVSLVWFNQGFWFGGAISNSSVWTPWNVFFTSALVLFILSCGLLTAFLVCRHYAKKQTNNDPALVKECDPSPTKESPVVSSMPASSTKGDSDPELGFMDEDADMLVEAETSDEPPNSANKGSKPFGGGGLWLEKMASFANGTSFACHVSLLGIQVTKLVDLDVYEYATIVSSLGSISTILILVSFRWFARKSTSFSMLISYFGHIVGTAILSIPQVYTLPQGWAVAAVVMSYGIILLSFFVMNLSCEVSLCKTSLKRSGGGKDAAGGMQMGYIKSSLSVGKVFGSALVAFAFRPHPQLPLWILEGFLLVALVILQCSRGLLARTSFLGGGARERAPPKQPSKRWSFVAV